MIKPRTKADKAVTWLLEELAKATREWRLALKRRTTLPKEKKIREAWFWNNLILSINSAIWAGVAYTFVRLAFK